MLKMKDISTEDFCRGLTNPQRFSAVNESRAKKSKMKIDNEVFIDILGRAGAVSPECKIKITDMATEGKTENELLRAIVDIANGKVPKGEAITSFKQISDEDFFAGLCRL